MNDLLDELPDGSHEFIYCLMCSCVLGKHMDLDKECFMESFSEIWDFVGEIGTENAMKIVRDGRERKKQKLEKGPV